MLLYTKTKDGYRIIATSQGVMVAGPTEELASKLLDRINQSKGNYCLYPNEIIFYDDTYKRLMPYEEHHQNQKTSFWQKLFGH